MELTIEVIEKLRTEFRSRKNEMGEPKKIHLKLIEYLFSEYYQDEINYAHSDVLELLEDFCLEPLNLKFLIECKGLEEFYQNHFKDIDQLIFEFMEETSRQLKISETPYYQALTVWAIQRSSYQIIEYLEQEQDQE